MDVGIGADTLIEQYGTENATTVERMFVLRQQGIVLPCLITFKGQAPQAAGVSKLAYVDSQRSPLKVSMEDGSSFISGYDVQVEDIHGEAIYLREAVGIPLQRGNKRSAFQRIDSPMVRSIIPIPMDMVLGSIQLHGHKRLVLANGVVAYT